MDNISSSTHSLVSLLSFTIFDNRWPYFESDARSLKLWSLLTLAIVFTGSHPPALTLLIGDRPSISGALFLYCLFHRAALKCDTCQL